MTAHLRSFLAGINASYWFYPALFSILAFVLALVTIMLDRSFAAEMISNTKYLVPARPDGASTMLQVIASTTIGVAATVFSITIAAVAYASGTYGPRLLTNFMEDKGNQLSLATFIGTFVYSVMVLRVVRAEDEAAASAEAAAVDGLPGFVPQLSLLVATGMMLASIAVLVFFLNHIPDSIRINTVLKQIGERLIRQIKHRFPHNGSDIEQPEPPDGKIVSANAAGYIEIIDFAGLEDIAKRTDSVIVLKAEAGDFVHPPMALVQIAADDPDDALIEEILDCFVLSGLRTPTQDLGFLLDELVEIALRALSPGINDPFTAMTALHWIGAATAELGGRVLADSPNDDRAQSTDRRVIPIMTGFEGYVAAGFGAARSAVATSRKATFAMFDAMQNCASALNNRDRVQVLLREGDLLMSQAADALSGPDLAEVHDRHSAFRAKLSNNGDAAD
ncbi:DUF2254 domain-containing protein [Croceicoccus hydrothermalis]|uniref:DUF2254 domain-containing protein n=1 Tax=Croceicoccus hydrothermalis TaxID=2867964 RepID=UPI001EFB7D9E